MPKINLGLSLFILNPTVNFLEFTQFFENMLLLKGRRCFFAYFEQLNPITTMNKLINLVDAHSNNGVSIQQLKKALKKEGILGDDPRLVNFLEGNQLSGSLEEGEFESLLQQQLTLKNALRKNLIIPDFEDFCNDISEIFNKVQKNKGGKVADYIPQLARVNPDQFAISICTIDGQRYSIGDFNTNFCLQSTCKPINYCLALEELGEEKVHQHVGREPSGRSFNELSLNQDGLPHNPLINAGAIMCASLIRKDAEISDRFDYVFNAWKNLCASSSVFFNNSVYLSERQTADRNFALAYFMRENRAFPEKTKLLETLEFYFQCCSIESCSHNLSVAAATLANAGVNPLTGARIFDDKTVQNCMSLMLSCGMYDFSGEFAFKIGLPAKSGVSGALLAVIPNVMGIALWSPRLDKLGNSVRGIEFCERLIDKYNFHHLDALTTNSNKKNPRKQKYEDQVNQTVNLIYAASFGDLDEIVRLETGGVDLSSADYDGRTALHLAAAENQIETVKFLLSRNVQMEPVDRWGGKPIDDAKRKNHKEIVGLLNGINE